MRQPAHLVSCVVAFGLVLSGCGGSHQSESGGTATGGSGGSGGSGGIVTSGATGTGGGTGTGAAPAQVVAQARGAAPAQVVLVAPAAPAAREGPEVLGEVWFASRVRRS